MKQTRASAVHVSAIRVPRRGLREAVAHGVEARGVLVISNGESFELRDQRGPRGSRSGCPDDDEQEGGRERARRASATDQPAGLSWRSLKRWILPVAVLGRSVTNSIQRGYL